MDLHGAVSYDRVEVQGGEQGWSLEGSMMEKEGASWDQSTPGCTLHELGPAGHLP